MDIQSITSEILDQMIEIRRHIHQKPELSMKEYNTTQLIIDTLKDTSIELQKLKNGTGVVGVLRGKEHGDTLGLRADIDALPIVEETGLEFSSEHEGIMHACGHDIHTTVMLGAALVLDRKKNSLKGNVKFIFQPGEETMQGAQFVIEQRVLESEPKVDRIVCLHTWPLIDAGQIGVRHGPIMAATDTFEIEVKGSGGHAAHPHKSVDPIPVAGQIVSGLQSIVSRQLSPLNSAVVTLGQIHGGNADNIIANKVLVSGTIRTLDPETRDHIKDSVAEMSEYIASGHKTTATVKFNPGSHPVINNAELVDKLSDTVKQYLGEESLVYLPEPSLGGEDFSFYLQKVEGMLFRLGTRNENEQSSRSLHNPGIIFDEKAIPTGIIAMSSFALEYLNENE
ncbi:M20 metallopeptidase family protein [Salinibacillus xinjiangensis]|uniref:Amidohydrolase n=1 Tax=Salinibacillus xinjiangensis TaxID=1229268 RepID=A0A6G1X8C9_9BACI|nr:M20 family metallopeptidase [Salinibacillus xinjiangensis]MRG87261.1 amidohydrolase [Salinibacillus xinjiangensis]